MTQSDLMFALAVPNQLVTLVPGRFQPSALFSWECETSVSL